MLDDAPVKGAANNINAVAAAELCTGISLTLVHYSDGWDFYDWQTKDGKRLDKRPDPVDTAQRFAASDDAFRYFQDTYGPNLKVEAG